MSSYERVELEHLPPSFFLTNRQNFIKNLKEHIVSIPENSYLFLMGGKERPRYDNDDELHYFLQESNFYYLTGVLEANYYATINLTDASFSLYIPLFNNCSFSIISFSNSFLGLSPSSLLLYEIIV